MKRDILTKRTTDGWASKDGRIRATRDTELRDSVKRGDAITTVTGRMTFWDVELLDTDGNVLDYESVNTLAEADDIAWWFRNRIGEGRA